MMGLKPTFLKMMCVGLLCSLPTFAIDYDWTGLGGDSSWTNPGNWDDGAGGTGFPNGAGDTATIVVESVMAGPVVTLNSVVDLSNLEFSYTSGTFSLEILNGGDLTVLNNGPQSPWLPELVDITVNTGGTLLLGSAVRKANKRGTTFDLAGTVIIDGGTFAMNQLGTIDSTGVFTVNGGSATFDFSASFTTFVGSQLIINGGTTTITCDDATFNGNVDVNTGIVNVTPGSSIAVNGVFQVAGGTVSLDNQFTGSITVGGSLNVTGGTVDVNDSFSLSNLANFDVSGGVVNANAMANFNFGSIPVVSGSGTVNFANAFSQQTTFNLSGGLVTNDSGFTFDNFGTFNFSGGSLEIDGAFSNQNSVVWTGGTWTGTGESRNDGSTTSFSIQGAGTKTLDSHVLKNQDFSPTSFRVETNGGTFRIINSGQFYNEGGFSWTDDSTIEVSGTAQFHNGFNDGFSDFPGNMTWSGSGAIRFLDNARGFNTVGTFAWEGTHDFEIDLNAVFENRDTFQFGGTGAMIAGPFGVGRFVNSAATFIRNSLPARFAGKRMPGPTATVGVFFESQSGSFVTCESGTLQFTAGGDFLLTSLTSQQTAGTDQAIEFGGGNFVFDQVSFLGDQGWIFSGGTSTFQGQSSYVFPTGTFFRFSGGTILGSNAGSPLELDIQSSAFTIEGNDPKQISTDAVLRPAVPITVMSGNGQLLFDGRGQLDVASDFQIISDADIGMASPATPGFTSLIVGSIFQKTMGVGDADPTVITAPFDLQGGIVVDGGKLEIAVGGDIDGSYAVASGAELLFSDGIVNAVDSGGLSLIVFDGLGTVEVGSNAELAFQNDVQIAVDADMELNGGRLSLSTQFEVNGGTLTVFDGEIGPPAMIRGGSPTVLNSNGTIEFANTSSVQLIDVTLVNDGNIVWSGSQPIDLQTGTTITNNGTFDITAEGRMISTTNDATGVNNTNTGTVIKSQSQNAASATEIDVPLNSTALGRVQITAGTLLISEPGMIAGQIDLGDGNLLDASAEFKVQNTAFAVTGPIMDSDGTANVTIDLGVLTTSNNFNIGGTLELINAGSLDMSDTGNNNSVGDLLLDGNLVNIANLLVSGQFSWSSGTLIGSGGTPFDGATPPPVPSQIEVTGTFEYKSAAATTLSNIDFRLATSSAMHNGIGGILFNGSGIMELNTTYSMASNTSIQLVPGANAGIRVGDTLQMNTPGTATVGPPIDLDGRILVSSGGTLSLTEALTSDVPQAFDSVVVDGNSNLQVPAGLNVNDGSIVVRDTSRISGDVTLFGGRLAGDGIISGNLDNQSGEVAPEGVGGPRSKKRVIGNLQVDGTYTQGSVGVLSVEVEEITLDTYEVDTLTVFNAVLDGVVDVTFIGNEPIPARDGFVIVTASVGLSGNFATVNLPAGVTPGLSAETQDIGGNEIALVFLGPASATWSGAGDGTTFSDANNWVNNERPAYNTVVTIDLSGGANVTLDRDYEVARLELGSASGVDNQQLDLGGHRLGLESGMTVFQNGVLEFGEGSALADALAGVVVTKNVKRKGGNTLEFGGRILVVGNAAVELTALNNLAASTEIAIEPVSAGGASLTVPGFTNLGLILLGDPTNDATASLILTGSGVLNNQGTVESLSTTGTTPVRSVDGGLNNLGTVSISDVRFEVDDLFNQVGGLLTGNGTLVLTGSGPDAIRLGGQVVPSDGQDVRGVATIGELRFIGPTLFQADLELEMDVVGPTEFDTVVIDPTSQVALAGSLLTRFEGGFQATVGDRIDLLTFGNGQANGDFTVVETPPTTNGIAFNPDLAATSYGIDLDAITPLVTPHLFVTDPSNPTGIVYDPADNSVVSALQGFGSGSTLHFSTDGTRAYLLSGIGGQVDIFDTSTLQITNTIFGLSNPVTMAANGDGSQLWILEEISAGIEQLSVYEVNSGTIVATATPCVVGASQIIYDSALDRFFVLSNGGDGCTYDADDASAAVDTFSFGGVPAAVQFMPNGDYLAISQAIPDDPDLQVVSFLNPVTLSVDFETELPLGSTAGFLDTVSDTEVAVSGGASDIFIVEAADTGTDKRLNIVDTVTIIGATDILGIASDDVGTLYAADPLVGDTFFDDGSAQGTLPGPPPGAFNFVPGLAGINKNRNLSPPEPGLVQFELLNLGSFSEDVGTVSVAVNRVDGSDGILVADISVDGGSTATSGVDFVLNTTSVSFGDGDVTPKTVTITVIDDSEVEGDTPERVQLNLSSEFLGSPDMAQFDIVDNDEIVDPGPNAIFLGQETFVVTEGGQISVAVTRTGDGIGRVTATLEALAGTAVPSSDYSFQSRALVFDNGEIGTQWVDVQTLDDNFVERTETFQLTLLSVTGAPVVAPSTATVSINDNDATSVSWTTASTSVAETTNKRDASVTVSAQLSAPATFAISVPYSVAGTAVVGEDHSLSGGVLRFQPGNTQAQLSLTIFGDNVLEPDETIVLTLAGNEASVGNPSIHTIRIINDDFDITDVDTQIVNLPENNRFTVSQMVQLEALGLGGVGGPYTFEWEICNVAGGCDTYSGQVIAPQFDKAGFYVVVARATDSQGNVDATPAQIRVQVLEDLPPQVEIGFPEADQLSVLTGAQQLFVAVVKDDGDDVSLSWYLSSDPDARSPGREYLASFPEPGNFIVVVEATDSAGQTASDSVEVTVADTLEIPVKFKITSPSADSALAVSETVNVNFSFDSGSNKKPFNFVILPGDGRRVAASAQGGSFNYTKPGRYFLRAFAVDGDRRFEDSITVFVRDPNRPPVIDIIPSTDISLDLSANDSPSVFFSALVVESNGYRDLNYFWDFGNGHRSLQRIPGRVLFPEEGTYEVQLFARTAGGLETATVTRTINVITSMQGRYEPNDSLTQAPTLTPGGYGNLVLNDESPVDVYKFEVTSVGQRVALRFIPDAPIVVDILDENENPVRSDTLTGGETLQYTGLEPGFYFCRMTPVEAFSKRFATLSYSLSIDVLNPAVYFSEVKSNALESTELGLVNLSKDTSSVELLGYDGNGSLVNTVEFNLNGSGRVNQSVAQLFGAEDARNIRWVQVNATSKLEGYSRVGSRDGKERYAVSGSKRLSSRLFVPHIAEGVNQWFTQATVVNGGASGVEANILTPTDERPLLINEAFSADQFDILDRFDGALESNIWALFENEAADAVLAGSEVFGTVSNEVRIVAGLELIDNEQDDPGFTYVANTLFFTHIASDVANFWTGLALVNTGGFVQGYRVKGYNRNGALILDDVRTLDPFQKLVQVAETFLAPSSPGEIDWVEIEADSQIVGFELFGTRNNKTMAGLEASNVLKTDICVPFIDASGQAIHGISVINPNTVANVVTLTLHSDSGAVIGDPVQLTLEANVKMSDTLKALFPSAFQVTGAEEIPGWLSIKGQQPIAGFQLVFEGNGEQMSGLIAQ